MACSYYHGIGSFECPGGSEDYKRKAIAWVKVEMDNGDIKTGKVTEIKAFNHYGDIINESTLEGHSVTCPLWIGDHPHVLRLCVCLPLAQSFKFTTNVDGANSTKPLL